MQVRNALLALALTAVLSASACPSFAQTPASQAVTPVAASAPTAVPALIPYSGTALSLEGKPIAPEANITFLIFKEESGGEPLFAETQSVALDPAGRYKVQLGATIPNGLPSDLFATGEARWLEVQIAGQNPQPRVLLASVPYALKAADATTLGGLPASAFALAATKSQTAAGIATPNGITPDGVSNVTTTGGVAGYIPEFSGASTIVDSPIQVTATKVAVGTTTTNESLEINGAMTVNGGSTYNGQLLLPAAGTATASTFFDSQLIKLYTSAWNSSTKAAVAPRFEWEAEVTRNDTAAPSATLNLLSSVTSNPPAETGFYFNADGTINFAPGQTLPSSGIVTGDLALPATSGAGDGVVDIGGQPFLYSYPGGKLNAFVGIAGNFTTTGSANVGAGYAALESLTSGGYNTAEGYAALDNDTTGFGNAAIGAFTLTGNETGNENTAIGYGSGPSQSALSNTTALGAFATAAQSNTLVLGNTAAATPGDEFVNVGIGTATPVSALEISVKAPGAVGPALTLTNSGGTVSDTTTSSVIDFYTQPTTTYAQPGARIAAVNDGGSDDLVFYSDLDGLVLSQNLLISASGQIVVSEGPYGTTTPNNAQFTIYNQGQGNQDGINTVGQQGDTAGSGIVAVGGTTDADFSENPIGGTGGFFTGGSAPEGTSGDGIVAQIDNTFDANSGGFAGIFTGDVSISGTLFASTKDFRIDDPLDPADKYLVHASVESSELMNIYSGNVVTDELGLATVTLPAWFEAENADFRYQLTVLGQFAQAIVKNKIADGKFTIMTNASHVEVSWQITAVRQDPYAKANPIVVEQPKPVRERGFYLHPEFYGQPREKQTEWGRHPAQMQRMKAQAEANRTASTSATKTLRGAKLQPQTGHPASAVNRNFAHANPPLVKAAAAVGKP
jgi:hypothetical protein